MKATLTTALLILPALVSAQETWQGLRFGMAIEPARAAISAKHIDVRNTPSGGGLQGTYKVEGFPFKYMVDFDTGKMNMVFLTLDEETYLADSIDLKDRASRAAAVNASVFLTLLTGYGKPVSQKGACDVKIPTSAIVNGYSATCDATWTVSGQVISYSCLWVNIDKLMLAISYKVKSSGL